MAIDALEYCLTVTKNSPSLRANVDECVNATCAKCRYKYRYCLLLKKWSSGGAALLGLVEISAGDLLSQ